MIDINYDECGVCYGKFHLNKNKTLKKHGFSKTWYGGKIITKPCEGSGKLSVQYSDITLEIKISRLKRGLEIAKQKNDIISIDRYNNVIEVAVGLLRKWNLKRPLKTA